jgi:hypothetical protein
MPSYDLGMMGGQCGVWLYSHRHAELMRWVATLGQQAAGFSTKSQQPRGRAAVWVQAGDGRWLG